MSYFKKTQWNFLGLQVSDRKDKMYNGILQNIQTGKIKKIPFGSSSYENFSDNTGLNAYPQLIHGDTNRQRLYKLRHQKDIKKGYWSAGLFSMIYLWS